MRSKEERIEKFAEGLLWCAVFNEFRPISEFHKKKNSMFGYQDMCKDAKKAANARSNPRRKDMSKMRYNVPEKAVYGFKEGDEFVYIGESDRTPFRLVEHIENHKGRSFAPEVSSLYRKAKWSYHILWYGDNDEYRKQQEKDLIALHQPKYNIRHK